MDKPSISCYEMHNTVEQDKIVHNAVQQDKIIFYKWTTAWCNVTGVLWIVKSNYDIILCRMSRYSYYMNMQTNKKSLCRGSTLASTTLIFKDFLFPNKVPELFPIPKIWKATEAEKQMTRNMLWQVTILHGHWPTNVFRHWPVAVSHIRL